MNFSAFDSQGRRKYLTQKEGERFLRLSEQIMPLNEFLLCKTLYFSGCRLSEALDLESRNIDKEEGVLQIPTLKKRSILHVRRVPIPSKLISDLEKLGQGSLWEISRTTAWRNVKAGMAIAEISGIHACPKGLRHGFGVRCALAGIPVTKIQTWMGHSKVETTAIYLDVKAEEDRELMSKTWPDGM